ncbi:MAG: phosphatase PAP2 family protein [Prevotellaceae bacterium]|nr:phosphatase PAP2 family protein [Prevotellaceae bacterium]
MILLFFIRTVAAQENPSTAEHLTDSAKVCRSKYVKWIVPAFGVIYGVAARFDESPVRLLDRHVADRINKQIDRRYTLDDWLQYVPAAAAYGLDFVPSMDSQNNLRDRTLLFAVSYAVMGLTIVSLKNSTQIRRPDGTANNSFPSGHTATAFAGAHLLYKEYKNHSLWIGVGGYVAATATGVMRVINKRHWVSDAVTGAAIGVLSVEAAYLLLPVGQRLLNIDKKDSRISILPTANIENSMGVCIVYRF